MNTAFTRKKFGVGLFLTISKITWSLCDVKRAKLNFHMPDYLLSFAYYVFHGHVLSKLLQKQQHLKVEVLKCSCFSR